MEALTVLCATCGLPTYNTRTRRCNVCWEVECLLEIYLKSEEGREFVREMLATYTD